MTFDVALYDGAKPFESQSASGHFRPTRTDVQFRLYVSKADIRTAYVHEKRRSPGHEVSRHVFAFMLDLRML